MKPTITVLDHEGSLRREIAQLRREILRLEDDYKTLQVRRRLLEEQLKKQAEVLRGNQLFVTHVKECVDKYPHMTVRDVADLWITRTKDARC